MPTARQYKAFRTWLESRGRSQGTIDLYVGDVRSAFEAGGFEARLGDRTLAPKTRHRIRTAGRQWARRFKNVRLEQKLRDFKLPKPRRATAKTPITRDELFALIEGIDRAHDLQPTMRAVLGMLACRGFRIGDVLRLRRVELRAAVESGVLCFEAKGGLRVEFRLLSTFMRHALTLANAEGRWSHVDALISPRARRQRRKAAARAVARALTEVAVRCGIYNLHPHRLRRTYAVEYLRGLSGDPEALMMLKEHMAWESMDTVAEYVNHARGQQLDEAAERIFSR